MKIFIRHLALLIFLIAPVTIAQVDAVTFATAEQENLYRDLLRELRCLVCANQSLSDSNSDLAGDLRDKVRAMVSDGRDRAAVVDYMTARYGAYILYRPQLSPATLFLWFAPPTVAVVGLALVVVIAVRSSRRRATDGADE